MAFVNLSVLALGGLLMGVPIVLHLLMKQRPRRQVFPALRFLQQRQASNRREMRLRNWLLLALRLALIGLLAALLSRPSVDSAGFGHWLRALLLGFLAPLVIVALAFAWLERKGRLLLGGLAAICLLLCGGFVYQVGCAVASGRDSGIGDAEAPVAAVLVFDVSPRMGLRHENRTRLEEAKGLARELIQLLPLDSEVAIVEPTTPGTTFALDTGVAVNVIDSLQVAGSEFPLHELVERGIELVKDRVDKRREVYVFTDLSRQAWRATDYRRTAEMLADPETLAFFVLDLGVDQPRNLQLSPPRLAADSLPRGRPLQIAADVTSLHVDQQVAAEILVYQNDPTRPVIVDGQVSLPELVSRDRVDVSVSSGGATPVEFQVRGLEVGVHHGLVRLAPGDGLSIDDARYFTVEVHPPWPVLLATSPGAAPRYVEAVLSPLLARERGEAWFACSVIDAARLTEQTLDDFAVVALLDPDALTAQHWQRLAAFVQQGGGLAVFLGRNASQDVSLETFNRLAADLLPGPLRLQWRAARDEVLLIAPRNYSHPILAAFRGRETTIPWDDAPILRHWSFADLKPGTNVVTDFSNGQPALLDNVLGAGRIVTMSTPVSDARQDKNRPAWNELPTGEQPLAFFMLMRETFLYLARPTDQRWNQVVGRQVVLRTDADSDETSWQLFTPAGDWQTLRSDAGRLAVGETQQPGTYWLQPAAPSQARLGFSVNLPNEATDLQRIDPSALDQIVGQDRYSLARDIEELDRGIGRARVGRELYPFLLLVIVAVLVMEYLVSNRFYANRRPEQTPARADRSRAA